MFLLVWRVFANLIPHRCDFATRCLPLTSESHETNLNGRTSGYHLYWLICPHPYAFYTVRLCV